MSKKLPYLEKRVPIPYSIQAKIAIAFDVKCKKLKVNKSNVVEELMLNFLKDTK